MKKRRQAMEDFKTQRENKDAAAAAQVDEDTSVLDNLLEKLRNGDTVGRRARRGRNVTDPKSAAPPPTDSVPPVDETVDLAKDMLARLQSDGFEAFAAPTSPTTATSRRRPRRRPATAGLSQLEYSPEASLTPELPWDQDGPPDFQDSDS